MTEPTTAAGRALLDALPLDEWHPMNREFATDHILAIEAEARQQDGAALRLLRMAAPRLAIGGAATDAWLFEVRAFLKAPAALPPSAPPALDVERLRQAWSNHMERDHPTDDYDPPTIECAEQAAAEYARLEPER